jgi:hypothetical protein
MLTARAKVLLAQQLDVRIATAEQLLDAYSTRNGMSLVEVARRYLAGELSAGQLRE